jgi:hypothetical protein
MKRMSCLNLVGIQFVRVRLAQFYCGYSGQSMVDDISAAAFNVVFTSLPILLFSVLDRPVHRIQTLLRFPQVCHVRVLIGAHSRGFCLPHNCHHTCAACHVWSSCCVGHRAPSM